MLMHLKALIWRLKFTWRGQRRTRWGWSLWWNWSQAWPEYYDDKWGFADPSDAVAEEMWASAN